MLGPAGAGEAGVQLATAPTDRSSALPTAVANGCADAADMLEHEAVELAGGAGEGPLSVR